MTATRISSHISPVIIQYVAAEFLPPKDYTQETCRTQEQFDAIHLKLRTSGQGRSRTFLFYFNCDKNFRVGPKYGGRVGKTETHLYFCLASWPS